MSGILTAASVRLSGSGGGGNGLLTGLTAYYALDEGSGSNALDSSGNSKTLTLNGSVNAAPAAGPLGDARNFSSGGFFSRTDSIFRPGSSPFSVAGWVEFDSALQFYPIITSVDTEWTAYEDVTGPISFNAGVTVSSGVTPIAFAWYYVACVWDGTNTKISVNGASFVSSAFAGPITAGSAPFILGAAPTGVQNLAGKMQGWAVWMGRAVSLSDFQVIYNSGLGFPFGSWTI